MWRNQTVVHCILSPPIKTMLVFVANLSQLFPSRHRMECVSSSMPLLMRISASLFLGDVQPQYLTQ